MKEREEFLQHFRSEYMHMAERLDTMTESQVLEGILQVKAARKVYEKEFAERIEAMRYAGPREQAGAAWAESNMRAALLQFVSVQSFFDCAKRLRLRTRAVAAARPTTPFDSLEHALHERLESLRQTRGNL